MESPQQKACFFDFDKTLVRKDSLGLFLEEATSRRGLLSHATRSALSGAGPLLSKASIGKFKTKFKVVMLQRILADMPLEEALEISRRVAARLTWNPDLVEIIQKHRQLGHLIVLATGALDFYMPLLLENIPYDHLLATHMEIVDQRLTGNVSSLNCTRWEKYHRVKAFIAEYGPFEQTWSYGNTPDDLPMMGLTDHRYIVKRGHIHSLFMGKLSQESPKARQRHFRKYAPSDHPHADES